MVKEKSDWLRHRIVCKLAVERQSVGVFKDDLSFSKKLEEFRKTGEKKTDLLGHRIVDKLVVQRQSVGFLKDDLSS
ncbi:hypothetical protein TNCV_143951 [Trichonephila clavipes]|nr:hypothetical protein TNCV_143951 [Trichonephila clavipes]